MGSFNVKMEKMFSFMYSAIQDEGFKNLEDGQEVEFF